VEIHIKATLRYWSKGCLYSPPGILPGIQLESRNSARLISEFDILVESAQNIMGIVFLLLCLVILYRVQPKSGKKKLNSVEHLVDFHGTSLRSSREIIMSPYEFTSKTHSLSTEDLVKIFIHSFIDLPFNTTGTFYYKQKVSQKVLNNIQKIRRK